LGAPVLPPDPIAFHAGETASGNAASGNAGSGVKPAGTLGISGVVAAHQQGGWAQVQQALQLRGRQPGGQRLGHRAQLPARHRGLNPLDGIGQHHGHVVADADAALGVGPGQPVRRPVEFGAGDGQPIARDRGLVGSELGKLRNLGADRRDWLTLGHLVRAPSLENAPRVVDQHGVQLLVGDAALL
jgi:hypothetical protein